MQVLHKNKNEMLAQDMMILLFANWKVHHSNKKGVK